MHVASAWPDCVSSVRDVVCLQACFVVFEVEFSTLGNAQLLESLHVSLVLRSAAVFLASVSDERSSNPVGWTRVFN